MKPPKTCRYCGAKVIFTSNAAIYGKEYGNGACYKCTQCDAYVGVHNGTAIPLGILADKELRSLKMEAHKQFDRAWKSATNKIPRNKAYTRLAIALGIPTHECHIGWFEKDMLLRVIEITKNEKWYVDVEAKREANGFACRTAIQAGTR